MHSIRNKAVVLVGAAALLAACVYLLLRARNMAPGYTPLRTFLDDASGLMDGTQVRLNGIPVGYLDAQNLTNSRDTSRKVEFVLRVRSRYIRDIPEDSTVGLASDNLLGDQYIGIRSGKSTRHIEPGGELAAVNSQDITRLMGQISRQLDRLRGIADRTDKLSTEINQGGGNIGKFIKNPPATSGLSAELDRLTHEIQHGHGTITKLLYDDPLAAQLKSPMDRLNAVTKGVDETTAKMRDFQHDVDLATGEFRTLQNEMKNGTGSFATLSQLQGSFDALSVKVDGMMDRINSGQGTLGQLLVNSQLNEALAGTTREFQELAKGLRANPRKFISIRVF
ncbi:MAG: MlaD family protein [Candidatus Solibacter sp.]